MEAELRQGSGFQPEDFGADDEAVELMELQWRVVGPVAEGGAPGPGAVAEPRCGSRAE